MKPFLFSLGAVLFTFASISEAKAGKQFYSPEDFANPTREETGRSHHVPLETESRAATYDIHCDGECGVEEARQALAEVQKKLFGILIDDALVLRHYHAHQRVTNAIAEGPAAGETAREFEQRVEGLKGAVVLALKNLAASVTKQTGFYGGNVVEVESTAHAVTLVFYKATRNENGKLVLVRTAKLHLSFDIRRGQLLTAKGFLVIE